MPELNEDIDIDDPKYARIRPTFLGGRAERRRLEAFHELYKFTEHPLLGPKGITPWWSSVQPIVIGDPGLQGTLQRAERLDVSPQAFVRSRSAVTKQWNKLDGLLRARLLAPVYGFVGRNSAQRIDDDGFANVVFIGGAWQIWIPNLTPMHIAALPAL